MKNVKSMKSIMSVLLVFTLLFGSVASFAGDWCTNLGYTYNIDSHNCTTCGVTKYNAEQIKGAASDIDRAVKRVDAAEKQCQLYKVSGADYFMTGYNIVGLGVSAAASELPFAALLTHSFVVYYASNVAQNVGSIVVSTTQQKAAKQELVDALYQLGAAQNYMDTCQKRLTTHNQSFHCLIRSF